jgi:penicillin amidase
VTRGGVGPWRAAAIYEALDARGGWTTDAFARVQAERLSIPHRDLARVLLEAAGRHRGAAPWDEVARELQGWDGRLDADSRAAALAVGTFRAIGERVIMPRLAGSPFARSLARRVAAVHRLVLDRDPRWVPEGDGGWDGVLAAAWTEAVADLTRRAGGDRAGWTWGAVNRMAVRHPLGRAASPLGRLLDPPAVAMGGFSTTPNVLVISPSGNVEGPSMRFVASLADPDDTRLVNFMGQSGHAASPHYGDQFDPWVRAEPQRLPFTEAAVDRDARHTLRLVP